jgi:hypothetical protein
LFLAGIFSALFAITFYCFKLPHIEAQLRNINGRVSESCVQRFDTYDKFYDALQGSIMRARTEVLLTTLGTNRRSLSQEAQRISVSLTSGQLIILRA